MSIESEGRRKLVRFQQLTEDIPSGVCANDITTNAPLFEDPKLTVKAIGEHISLLLKTDCNIIINKFNLQEKLTMLEKNPNVWKPKTGQSHINTLKAKYLNEMKKELMKKIEETKNESKEIQHFLKHQTELTEKQMKSN